VKQVQQNYRTGELKVAETPAPRVSAGGLLVATRTSLISAGTEKQLMALAKASLAGKAMSRPDLVRRVLRNMQRDGVLATVEKVLTKLDTPIPLGYSLAGVVLEVGRKVSGFSVGDRVACAGAGAANHAEYNVVPKNLVAPIPDGVSDADASFVTLGAIALQGVRLAVPTLGERVLVMGLGLIGLISVQLLKASGCRVLGFDPDPSRVALALKLGADIAVSDGLREHVAGFTAGYGADAVVLTASSPSSEPLNLAAEVSRMKGRIVVVGQVGMTIDREPFYKRELELKLSMSYGPGRHDPAYEQDGQDYPLPYVRWTEQRNMESFLDLVAQGKVTPAAFVTHRYSISEAEKAYAMMETGEPHLGILLDYPAETATPLAHIIKRPDGAAVSAGKTTLGIGFVGLGNYAKGVLLPALKKLDGVQLSAVATATGISANHAGEKHGFALVATDPQAVCADSQTDIVFVATRHDTHAAIARQALDAGKHVFCEKPLATTVEDLDAVMAAAAASDRHLTVGFNRRFAPHIIAARAALTPRSGPLVMMYRVNAGAIPVDSWIQRDEGGGRIIGEVCHFVDTLTFLAGALPVEVQAITAKGLPDAASVLVRFADGSTGAIVYSSLGDAAVSKEYLEVFAAGRVVQLDDFRTLTITSGGKSKVSKSAQDKGQNALVAAYIQAIRDGAPPPIPLAEIAAVSEASIAIEDSLRTGGPIGIESAS
jgi:predicted dehydrogenase/threonine dehydrogenase-like Zn-dependent dehydrogenase